MINYVSRLLTHYDVIDNQNSINSILRTIPIRQKNYSSVYFMQWRGHFIHGALLEMAKIDLIIGPD